MVFNGKVNSDFLKLSEFPSVNKPALINFAATDFEVLRNSLISYIKAVYPQDYQNFTESDLGVMLIELVAYMGAVMSMKADMLAHENYLSTAKSRNNVRKLLELIGIKLKGPISAAANASFELNTATAASSITIPAASRVFTITSPEDGGLVTYTLYKTQNGQISDLNSTADLELLTSESFNSLGVYWDNLMLLEGSLVSQTGTFTNTDANKIVVLTESPIAEKSINVYIDSTDATALGPWKQVDSLYQVSGEGSKSFEVLYTDDFAATVVFGDGVNGAAVPVGSSYLITYRIGGGTRGNIANEVINVTISTESGESGTVQNISVGSGGQDAESVIKAKRYAPLIFKTQDRLVTAQDYAVFANNFAGNTGATGKARAVVRDAYSSANIIDLYLLQVASNIQLQQATVQFKSELLNAIEEKKMLTDEIVIVDGVIRTLDLVITLRVDKNLLQNEESIKSKVRDVLLTYFDVNNFDFGRPLLLSEVVRAILNVQEVRFATIDNFDDDVFIDFNEIIQLNNFVLNVVGV
jgi:hypothetical protein